MEKLQVALDRARKSRRDSGGSEATGHRAQKVRQKPTDKLLERWRALRPFEVRDKDLVAHRVVTLAARKSATPFDILRTKALLQMRQNGWKRLAITSPMPNSGKTTVACNLILGLGRQSDLRSMLFDLDLRAPSVGDFFGARPSHGISEMINGAVAFEKQAMRIGDNVAISMAQRTEIDPTRILLAGETADRLNEIQGDYEPDVMIFDLPSLLVNDESRAFLNNADCALIVIRAGTTQYSQFETCQREVAEHTNVLGVVFNAYRYDKRAVDTA